MKRFVLLLVLTGALTAFAVASASADPGTSGNNPRVQYRTFSCDNGQTYSGGFVGFAAADFFVNRTRQTFAIKVFTVFSSPPKTFYTGIQGYPGPLITCSYTDPLRATGTSTGVQAVVPHAPPWRTRSEFTSSL
jgi:hypothetical protein